MKFSLLSPPLPRKRGENGGIHFKVSSNGIFLVLGRSQEKGAKELKFKQKA